VLLVAYGKAVPSTSPTRHPRTCVGVDKAGTKLYLLVVDGRDADRSVGMSYSELSQQMLKLGAYHAINLDGGGSTTLVMRDPSNGELHVLNQPSDHRERPVANVLGIRLHPTTQPTR
jgi:exopolysaccharide biosynthesis protein